MGRIVPPFRFAFLAANFVGFGLLGLCHVLSLVAIYGIVEIVALDLFGDAQKKIPMVFGQLGLLDESGVLEAFLNFDNRHEVVNGEIQVGVVVVFYLRLGHGLKIVISYPFVNKPKPQQAPQETP